MKKNYAYALILFLALFTQSLFAADIEGRWTTIDDKTGQKRSVIALFVRGNTLYGTIVDIYKMPGDTGICQKCPGGFKGKPIKGLRIMWGLKQNGPNSWSGGEILDPKSGKIYNVKIKQNGNRLEVRGFVGISLLGRTQTWVR